MKYDRVAVAVKMFVLEIRYKFPAQNFTAFLQLTGTGSSGQSVAGPS